MKTTILFKLIRSILILAIASSAGYSHNQTPIIDKANELIRSLNASQKEKLLMSFENKDRDQWTYFPNQNRIGLSLKEITPTQKELVFDFLREHLSKGGFKKMHDVMQLEEVLFEIEGSAIRDSEKYFLAFFGTPAHERPWSWSFEGHHVSLNFTIVNGRISTSPTFLGSNPGEVSHGRLKGLRVLKTEEDLGLELINSMTENQKAKAIISEKTYGEIVTKNDSRVAHLGTKGIEVKALTPSQKELLRQLLDVYIFYLTDELADLRNKQIANNGFENLIFSWAGSTSRKAAHYYRIQGDKFLIELDNSQNNANHVHIVWRDFDGDFGRDLIREHYKKSIHH